MILSIGFELFCRTRNLEGFYSFLESVGFIVEHESGVAFLPFDNEDQVLLLRVADLLSQLQERMRSKKPEAAKKAKSESSSLDISAVDIFVDPEVTIFKENIASASLRTLY